MEMPALFTRCRSRPARSRRHRTPRFTDLPDVHVEPDRGGLAARLLQRSACRDTRRSARRAAMRDRRAGRGKRAREVNAQTRRGAGDQRHLAAKGRINAWTSPPLPCLMPRLIGERAASEETWTWVSRANAFWSPAVPRASAAPSSMPLSPRARRGFLRPRRQARGGAREGLAVQAGRVAGIGARRHRQCIAQEMDRRCRTATAASIILVANVSALGTEDSEAGWRKAIEVDIWYRSV